MENSVFPCFSCASTSLFLPLFLFNFYFSLSLSISCFLFFFAIFLYFSFFSISEFLAQLASNLQKMKNTIKQDPAGEPAGIYIYIYADAPEFWAKKTGIFVKFG